MLPHNTYQVALVECSYIPSGIILKKGELLCTYKGTEHFAEKDYYNIEDVVKQINIPSSEFNIKNGYVHARYDTKYNEDRVLKKLRAYKKLQQENDPINLHPIILQRLNSPYSRPVREYFVQWSPSIAAMLGYDEESNTYIYPIFTQVSTTNLYIYLDVIENQRVGNQMVPLLRKIVNTGEPNQQTTQEFTHLEYKNLCQSEFDAIHCCIRTEDAVAPAFEVGTFSATLHFRPKKYGGILHNIAV
jgi:hypothetical protein